VVRGWLGRALDKEGENGIGSQDLQEKMMGYGLWPDLLYEAMLSEWSDT
jgi:hypothetical protein